MVTGLLAIGALLKEDSPRKIAKLYFINCKHINIQSTFFTHPEERLHTSYCLLDRFSFIIITDNQPLVCIISVCFIFKYWFLNIQFWDESIFSYLWWLW